MAALMRHRKDADGVLIASVNHPVGESVNKHSPMREPRRRACSGVFADQRDGPLDFGREDSPQAGHPGLVEQGGARKLSFRLGME